MYTESTQQSVHIMYTMYTSCTQHVQSVQSVHSDSMYTTECTHMYTENIKFDKIISRELCVSARALMHSRMRARECECTCHVANNLFTFK